MQYFIGGLAGFALGLLFMALLNVRYLKAIVWFTSRLNKGQGMTDKDVNDVKRFYWIK
jgi:hypothetical protein